MNPIRVIPWQHEITRQSHRDIIAFLSTIRSGTHLGLEISQAEKQAYVLALREPAFLKEKILRLPREQLVQILSGIEVLHICIERGIQIHPLESERAMKIIQRARCETNDDDPSRRDEGLCAAREWNVRNSNQQPGKEAYPSHIFSHHPCTHLTSFTSLLDEGCAQYFS